MVTLIAKIKAQQGKEGLLAEECVKIAGIVREKEKGCLMYVPHVAVDNPLEITFFEQYADEEAFKGHTKTPYFQEFSRNVAGLLDGPLQIQILKQLV